MKNGSLAHTPRPAADPSRRSQRSVRPCSQPPSQPPKSIRWPICALKLPAYPAGSAVSPTLSCLGAFPKLNLQPFRLRSVIRACQSEPSSKNQNPVKLGKVLVNFWTLFDHRLHRNPLKIENRSDFGQFWSDFVRTLRLFQVMSPHPSLRVAAQRPNPFFGHLWSSLVISPASPEPCGMKLSSPKAHNVSVDGCDHTAISYKSAVTLSQALLLLRRYDVVGTLLILH
jgi:hypothetical protein